jgi:hypothetical protein
LLEGLVVLVAVRRAIAAAATPERVREHLEAEADLVPLVFELVDAALQGRHDRVVLLAAKENLAGPADTGSANGHLKGTNEGAAGAFRRSDFGKRRTISVAKLSRLGTPGR